MQLESCQKEEHRVMAEMKSTVTLRKIDDAKLVRKMVTLQLKTLRGYDLDPTSTFQQRIGTVSKNITSHGATR